MCWVFKHDAVVLLAKGKQARRGGHSLGSQEPLTAGPSVDIQQNHVTTRLESVAVSRL